MILITIVTALSCKKVIQVDLNNAAPQIVITGAITNTPGPYQVSVSRTVNFSDFNQFPPVEGALVILSDNKSFSDTLVPTTPGSYSSHPFWQGTSGTTYTLHVTIDSTTWSATSTMPFPVPLDSIGFSDQSRLRKTNIQAIPYFQDPPGLHNYYLFTETINGIPRNKDFIFDDRLSDGKYIHQPINDDSSHLNIGDNLLLTMSCVDSAVYSYLTTLIQNTDANQAQSTAPANPNTNISGGALGYFSARTLQSKQVVVHL